MDVNSQRVLEFFKIKEKVKEYAQSNLGARLIEEMEPSSDPARVRLLLQETREARLLMDSSGGSHPLAGLHDIAECLDRAEKGGVLHPEELERVSTVLRGCSKLKKYMRGKRALAPVLSSYAEAITEFPLIVDEIEKSVAGAAIVDSASPALGRVRAQMRIAEERIRSALMAVISSSKYKEALQEGFITQKSGRYVVAIKATHRAMIPGSVIASSSSGATVFIEPAAVGRQSEELRVLEAQEEAEEYQVLVTLTGAIAEQIQPISVNLEALGHLDLVFARGRYAAAIDAVEPEIVDAQVLDIRDGHHPMLGKDAVPLNLMMGKVFQTLVITGPNTGGKTVVLKTAGLFCLMAQSGMHVPAAQGTRLGVFNNLLADIGDAQSIENSLSTFSSHVGNIARILKMVGPGCLVLIDEIGTGTDPAEGAALACSVLDELWHNGAVTVVTTHYGDVKRFADSRRGFVNGCMEFDPVSLRPLYVLTVGRAGESNAFWIAERLGIGERVIAGARKLLRRDASEADSSPGAGLEQRERVQAKPKPTGSASARTSAFEEPRYTSRPRERQFLRGDCVFVPSRNCRAIVDREEDELGNVSLAMKGLQFKENWKRLKMVGKREDIYPDGGWETYDLDIVLLSKADRKVKHEIERKATDKVRVIKQGVEKE